MSDDYDELSRRRVVVAFRALCVAFCLLGAAGAMAAADEPSLSDTDAWLEHHLPTSAQSCNICATPATSTTWDSSAVYHASACTLSATILSSVSPMGIEPSSQPIYHLDLAPQTGKLLISAYHEYVENSIDHVSAKVNFADISPNDIKTTAASAGDSGLPPINVAPNGTSIRFTFDDEEMANRVKRAFERAIVLCGGKPEPF
jgi:hypothetical protein